jgi:nitrite reductase/ring-hydroxylating ferredoxin subunit
MTPTPDATAEDIRCKAIDGGIPVPDISRSRLRGKGELMAKYVVAPAHEIAPGSRKLVEVAGRKIVIFNLAGEFFALSDRCPHQGGPLSQGRLTGFVSSRKPGEYCYSRRGEVIRCPWHSWEYDIRTGKSWCDPRRVEVRRFEVGVEPGARLVEGPYVAETFPVSVEDAYLVVTV